MTTVNNPRYFAASELRLVMLAPAPRSLTYVEALEAQRELAAGVAQLRASLDREVAELSQHWTERDEEAPRYVAGPVRLLSHEQQPPNMPDGSWSVTVPSMLIGDPLVVVGFDASKGTGYIEVPAEVLSLDLSTARRGVMRVRCPLEADRLRAMVTVVAGWPLR